MNYYYNTYNDRQFLVPFLLGGIGGAAIVNASRPRPVFVTSPNYNYNPYPPYNNYPYGYNYYSSYNYYPPR